ncbi:MAG: tetratricopeptide repeat protein [Prevotella sp.]|nr:tetratricopeptide repeat protein [Prevotella sp.]
MKKTGDEYFDSEEFRNTLESYEESVRSGHPLFLDADDLADIADYYHFTGIDQQADEVIEYALSLYPNATLPNVFKAREALAIGDYDSAVEYIEQIENQDDPEYHYMQAELLIAKDQVEKADEYLREYFATVPPEEYQDFVYDIANIYFDYGLSDKAYEWLMRTKGDGSNDFKELMARILFGLGKYKDSERIFNELLDRDPYSKRYWNGLANAQFMNEDFSGSVTSSEYAIAIDPNDADSLLNKANALYRLGNFEEAIRYYDRFGELVQPDEFSLLHKGSSLVNLNRHDEAFSTLLQALKISPPDSPFLPQIYQELAFCCSTLGRLDEALDYIERTRDLDCDHIDMLVLKGHILLEHNHIHEAEEVFKNAMIRSEEDPLVILRILVSLYDNKYVKAAYEMFKKFFALIVNEDFNQGYSYMALCCWDLNFTEEFLMYLRLAVERNPREARQVLGHLFPEEMAAKDYYQYMYNKLKK